MNKANNQNDHKMLRNDNKTCVRHGINTCVDVYLLFQKGIRRI